LQFSIGVKPIRLREQVKRNIQRFPGDFMFQLDEKEIQIIVSQNAIPSSRHLGGHHPYVFTEQGVAMLATVLNTEKAVLTNIAIMRAFVKLREVLLTHKKLSIKLARMEQKIGSHDHAIQSIFEAIRQLMTPQAKTPKKIGFKRKKE
jgi:hypothetical protein